MRCPIILGHILSIAGHSSHSQIGWKRWLSELSLTWKGLLFSLILAMRRVAPLSLVLLSACSTHAFSGSKAFNHVRYLHSIGPHPVGSRAQEQARDYITQSLQTNGWQVQVNPFSYRGIQGFNILAFKGDGPGILLGTHYDTRPVSDRNPPHLQHMPVPGANDGNSGTAVLLELARCLKEPEGFRLWLAFFDAEDRGNIEGWPFSVGAYFASQLNLDLAAVIVVDMVGDANLEIYQEANSDRALTESIWRLAQELGLSKYFIPQVKYSIIDDHLPFASRGIPSALLIDFDYPYWHTSNDTPDKVSPKSLEIVGSVLKAWVEKEGKRWTEKR